MKRYCGRPFSGEEIGQLGALIADHPGCTRAQLSRLACRLLQWRKADGGLKEMSCRVAMLRLHREGLLQLPPPRNRKGGSSRIEHTFWSAPQEPLSRPVHELPGVHLEPVLSRPDSALWNEYIDRYHYLGYTHCPELSCATSLVGRTAPWPCLALVPPPGKPPLATASSAGVLPKGRETFN